MQQIDSVAQVAIDGGGVGHQTDAAALQKALKANGVLVRYFDTPALAGRLRITVGTEAQNQRLIELLEGIMAPAQRTPE